MIRVMAAALLSFASATVFAAPAATPAVRVAMAPSGAYVMGSPTAKVKLIEYVSYTCSHCAHFIEEASAPLKDNYVSKGLVSVEMRNLVRDPFDMTAALLARCGGPAKVFGNSEAIFARQAVWMADAQVLATKQGAALQKLPVDQRLMMIANSTDLGAIMKGRGFTQPQINACLANKAAQNQLVLMTKEAQTRKVPFTPYFLINGKPPKSSGHWETLEPELKAALGR
jgi:protein-disulfide isomerase